MTIPHNGWWRCNFCGKKFRVRSVAGIAHYANCGPKLAKKK